MSEEKQTLNTWAKVEEHIFGNPVSVFTLVSLKTGSRFTYRFTKTSRDPNLYFANLLGENKFGEFHFAGYIGHIKASEDKILRWSAKVKFEPNSPAIASLKWFTTQLHNRAAAVLNDKVQIYPILPELVSNTPDPGLITRRIRA